MRHGRYPFIFGFLIAPVALYVVFVIAPYVQAFYIALTNWRGFAPPTWAGFDNFTRMAGDDSFWKALRPPRVLVGAFPVGPHPLRLFFPLPPKRGGGERGRPRF